jgi:hypothetical protein
MGNLICQILQVSFFAIAGSLALLVFDRTRSKTHVWLIISVTFFAHVLRSLIIILQWSSVLAASDPYESIVDIISALLWIYIAYKFLTIPSRVES